MNLSKPLRAVSRLIYSLYLRTRRYLPSQRCISFGTADSANPSISKIFVINLDRQPSRWVDVQLELDQIVDASGRTLAELAVRHSACDAQAAPAAQSCGEDINAFYTLADQLFVEPQPQAVPDAFDLELPIRMSDAEIAVARSHIEVWKRIARSDEAYSLVLEDDAVFERGFGKIVDQAWREMKTSHRNHPAFDVLYLSYKEVRYGAPKELISKNVFRPERGLWYLSGYVLSKKGARKLLDLLPCYGPVDLWINHKFSEMDVRALRRSVISQRRDLESTNSYSILPALSRIGILDQDGEALFKKRPNFFPVFVFGPSDAGLSSIAMALSMLGYRCCSDLDHIPEGELQKLLDGNANCVFDAYINIGILDSKVRALVNRYPQGKFIVVGDDADGNPCQSVASLKSMDGVAVLTLTSEDMKSWRRLCEFLRLAPPSCPYPVIPDIGRRKLLDCASDRRISLHAKQRRQDVSPWVVEATRGWTGIHVDGDDWLRISESSRTRFEDNLTEIPSERWLLRNDTFPGNLGLFRPTNVTQQSGGGQLLHVREELLGVRNLSAAAISSRDDFLYGRFEATLKATDVPGLVTGFFLHRDSPRQEIDIEIAGNRPDYLLVNVFYNPGTDGARFDYGYLR